MKKKMINPNEASRIMDRINKGEDWRDDFWAIDEELGFVADALDVSVVATFNIEGAGKLGNLLNDVERRVEKVKERIEKLQKRLHDKGRLGAFISRHDEKDQYFLRPVIRIEKTPLGWRKGD